MTAHEINNYDHSKRRYKLLLLVFALCSLLALCAAAREWERNDRWGDNRRENDAARRLANATEALTEALSRATEAADARARAAENPPAHAPAPVYPHHPLPQNIPP